MTRKYGWLRDPDPTSPRLHLEDYAKCRKLSLVEELREKFGHRHPPRPVPPRPVPAPGFTVPAVETWGTGLTYPMLGNDQYGDCVEACMFHAAQLDQFLVGGVSPMYTEVDTLAVYSAITGFNASNPATDQGTSIPAALNWWLDNPLTGSVEELAVWFQVLNRPGLPWQDAIFLTDNLIIGVNLPASAETQFDLGQKWTVVSGSPIVGGHCILLTGYDATEGLWTGVTWGGVVQIATNWLNIYAMESYCVVSKTLAADPTLPDKLGTAQANADWLALTGRPGPFHA